MTEKVSPGQAHSYVCAHMNTYAHTFKVFGHVILNVHSNAAPEAYSVHLHAGIQATNPLQKSPIKYEMQTNENCLHFFSCLNFFLLNS